MIPVYPPINFFEAGGITIDTQKSKLEVRLVLEVLAKLMVGENSSWEFPKVMVRLTLEVHLILETRGYVS